MMEYQIITVRVKQRGRVNTTNTDESKRNNTNRKQLWKSVRCIHENISSYLQRVSHLGTRDVNHDQDKERG